MSIAEQVRQSFGFSVDKLPLRGPEGLATPFYGLFRSDTGEVASKTAVSRQYSPHKTDDVVALAEACEQAFDGQAVKATCLFKDGHHVVVQPGKEYRRSIFGTADNIFPRVIIRAGYDGRAFRATLGAYRDACRNLMMLRRVSGISVAIRHDSNIRENMDDLIRKFATVASRWRDVEVAAEEMQSRDVRLTEFLTALYGEPSETSRTAVARHKSRTEAIVRRVIRERYQTGRPDLGSDFVVSGWEAYNAVQGYVQHESRRNGHPSDIERAIAALGNASVMDAERLVFDLAL